MATIPVLMPVEEYLTTVYRPDCDYIDGEILERNMGEKPHSRLQKFFLKFLEQFEESLRIEAFPEQRLQINATRYRVPDVMVISMDDPELRIVRTAPLLCIEILSSEDHMRKIQERLDDYAALGVKTMWVIDPWRGVCYTAGPDAKMLEVTDRLGVEGTAITITVDEIFAELDRLERRSAPPPTAS